MDNLVCLYFRWRRTPLFSHTMFWRMFIETQKPYKFYSRSKVKAGEWKYCGVAIWKELVWRFHIGDSVLPMMIFHVLLSDDVVFDIYQTICQLPTIFWSEIGYSLFDFFNAFNNFSDSFTFGIFQTFISLHHFNDRITFSRIQCGGSGFSSAPSGPQSEI